MSTVIGARYQKLETLNQGHTVIALDPQTGGRVRLDMAPAGSDCDRAAALTRELIKRYADMDHRLPRPIESIIDQTDNESRVWIVSSTPKGEPISQHLDNEAFMLSAKIQLINDLVRVLASYVEVGGQPIHFTTSDICVDPNLWTLS